MPVLTTTDRAFFDENGYVVVHDAAPPENLQAVVDAIFTFLEMNPHDPDDWYRAPLSPGGMIEMYQHPALWANRQCPRIYETFAELLGEARLHVSIDRANLKPPFRENHPRYDHKGFTHWDLDSRQLPTRLGVQGVLCLTDTTEEMGGFQCVPGFHKDLEAWIMEQPDNRNPRIPDLSRLPTNRKLTPVPARAGDLIIWNTRLAHGNGRNLSKQPRLAQYLTMRPASDDEALREERVRNWRERLAPSDDWVIGDPRGWERTHGETAELTPLGRKLLGLDEW